MSESSSSSVTPVPTARALVLGGGGPVGRAWQTGLAAGFIEAGIELGAADLIVGTSAGAIVGAEIALRHNMSDFVPATPSASPSGPPSAPPAAIQQLMASIAAVATSATPELELQRIGQFAISANTPSEEIAVGRPNLAGVTGIPWPSNLQATSVSTTTGLLQVWTAQSGVPLEKGLAASSALPGVWPAITIGADRYMDGGVSGMLHVDLAKGYSRVVVVSCFSLEDVDRSDPRHAGNKAQLGDIEMLGYGGSAVELVAPDEEFLSLTGHGTLMLNPALEAPAFELGRQQAHNEAARILSIWGE
jgi:NTE family protein